MGYLVKTGVLKADGTLTDVAKNSFINSVKEAVVNGTQNAYACGDPLPPVDPPMSLEEFRLEDEVLYESFHRDILKGRLESTARKMDSDPSFSLLPIVADPVALAGSFGVRIQPPSFPDGFTQYFTPAMVPLLVMDLIKSGVKDYLLPVDILPELKKLLTIPTPPNVIPDIPIPSPPIPPDILTAIPAPPEGLIPDVPIPSAELPTEIPSLPEGLIPEVPIPSANLPPIPTVDEFQSAIEREVAVVKAIPDLLMKLISEVPKLLPKILNPAEMIAYICKLVTESGAFPLEDPANSMEKAYNAVLSRWFAYFLYLGMISKTLGCSEGSVAPAIASSPPMNLKPPEPEEPTEAIPVETPEQRVLRAARQIGGSGIAWSSDQSGYISTLFYMEEYFAGVEAGTVTATAEVPDPDATKEFNNNPKSYTKDGIAETALKKRLGVNHPEGFRTMAGWSAITSSSCGLFTRYCYFAGGCVNKFFLSLYPFRTAIAGIKILGRFRNYKWLLPPATPEGKYTFNEDLAKIAATVGTDVSTEEETNKNISLWDYEIDSNGNLKAKHIPRLTPHLKDFNDLAMISEDHLGYIAKSTAGILPDIEPGDLILIHEIIDGTEGDIRPGSEHVLVYDASETLKGLQFPILAENVSRKLPQFISGIHGGQPDDGNPGTLTGIPVGFVSLKSLLINAKTMKPQVTVGTKVYDDRETSKPPYPLKQVTVIGETQTDGSNFYLSPIELSSYGPTSILPGDYNIGYYKNDGFYIARSFLRHASGAALGDEDGENPYPGSKFRRISAIFKTKNFLKPVENADTKDPGELEASRKAIAAMDNHPLMNQYVFSQIDYRGFVYNCFHGVPEGKPWKK